MKFNKFTGQFEALEEKDKQDALEARKARPTARLADQQQKDIDQVVRDFFDAHANTKEKMIMDVINMGANDDRDELLLLNQAIEDLIDRLKLYEDTQLKTAKRIAFLYLIENLSNDIELHYQKAWPIIRDLAVKKDKDEVDLIFSTMLCAHTVDFDTLVEFTDIILEEAIGRDSVSLQINTHSNVLLRLIRLKYREIGGKRENEYATLEEVTERFDFHISELNKLSDENGYPVYKALALVREGMFRKDFDKIDKGILTLRDLGEIASVNILLKEVDDLFELEVDLKEGK